MASSLARYKRVVMFLADGSRPDVFEALAKKGDLPNLSRYCAERGGYQSITTVFPSTTGPAYLPYLTGCYPGTCNVPGIRWFDKARYAKRRFAKDRYRSYVGFETGLINSDCQKNVRTLFELLPKSYNILNAIYRGTARRRNLTYYNRIWLLYYGHLTDRWDFVDAKANAYLRRAIEEDFDFIFVVFPGIDEFSHRSHPFEDSVLTQYRYVDTAFGAMVERLKEQGRWDETLFLLVSDHGLSSTSDHFELYPFLGKHGLKTFHYPRIHQICCEAASMVSGNGMAHLYLDIRSPRGIRLYYDDLLEKYSPILTDLKNHPAVDVMACQDRSGKVHFFIGGEEGIVEDGAGYLQYSFARRDPLGLFTAPTILDYSSALDLTVRSPYPDILMQLAQLFRAPRSGDLVISAKPGWDFRRRFEVPLHKASHGSLAREHMRIPCFSSHPLPDLPLRSVDLFPFILRLLGKEIPDRVDGRVLDFPNESPLIGAYT